MDRSRPGRKGISREPTQEEIDARKKRMMDARMEAHEKNKTGPFRETPGRVKGMMTGGMCRGMGAAIKGGKFEGVK